MNNPTTNQENGPWIPCLVSYLAELVLLSLYPNVLISTSQRPRPEFLTLGAFKNTATRTTASESLEWAQVPEFNETSSSQCQCEARTGNHPPTGMVLRETGGPPGSFVKTATIEEHAGLLRQDVFSGFGVGPGTRTWERFLVDSNVHPWLRTWLRGSAELLGVGETGEAAIEQSTLCTLKYHICIYIKNQKAQHPYNYKSWFWKIHSDAGIKASNNGVH